MVIERPAPDLKTKMPPDPANRRMMAHKVYEPPRRQFTRQASSFSLTEKLAPIEEPRRALLNRYPD
jgi:hypothetical protein